MHHTAKLRIILRERKTLISFVDIFLCIGSFKFFSVAKATLQSQMSVRPFVRLSVSPKAKPFSSLKSSAFNIHKYCDPQLGGLCIILTRAF